MGCFKTFENLHTTLVDFPFTTNLTCQSINIAISYQTKGIGLCIRFAVITYLSMIFKTVGKMIAKVSYADKQKWNRYYLTGLAHNIIHI